MMQVKITVSDTGVQRLLSQVNSSMRDKSALMDRIGDAVLKHVKNRIRTGGFGSWVPLAQSTKEKTGRSKPQITLIPFIRVRTGANSATVYFSKRPTEWSQAMHERGFTSRAVRNTPMGYKKAGGGKVKFRSRKKSVIPGRRITPTQEELDQIVMPIADAWLGAILRRQQR
jgi:hypothetical protein